MLQAVIKMMATKVVVVFVVVIVS